MEAVGVMALKAPVAPTEPCRVCATPAPVAPESTLVRRLPRRLASVVRFRVRPLAGHPWKQDLLRTTARRPE